MTFDYSIIPAHIRITNKSKDFRGIPPVTGPSQQKELAEIRALEAAGVIKIDEHTQFAVNRERYFQRKRIKNCNNV